jgi:cysteinyl-tRNA synthetase
MSEEKTESTWKQPSGTKTGIFVLNSLTHKKEELILRDGRSLTWYTCGPTVYDASHMGHARSYVGFDIIRRIIEDYFHIDVFYVVNITDVDDKIIKKGNLVHLNKVIEWLKPTQMSEDLAKIFDLASKRVKEDSISPEKALSTYEIVDLVAQLKTHGTNVLSKEQVLSTPDFDGVSRHFENLYWKDMKDLQVKNPTVITRVTEYVPEVVTFIETIIKNGYAYESNGSVYFDTKSFKEKGHSYAKLEPWSVMDYGRLGEGEGELSQKKVIDKKTPNDFALWKKSNVGEPFWKSPWGEGRPGWHIECSAMASDILKEIVDVHCGGVDLRFPHHDNEIAQSEAHFDCHQWVNYFWHAGHLNIEGRTMSKSKKNFITIRGALDSYSSRHIRWLFLLHRFNDGMDYSEQTMVTAQFHDKLFNEFFQNVKVTLRENDLKVRSEKWVQVDRDLHKMFMEKKKLIHEALCDNFDTPKVIKLLSDVIGSVNTYLKGECKSPLLIEISAYMTNLMRIFGFEGDAIGFSTGAGDFETEVRPILDTFVNFREQVRDCAKLKKEPKEILILSDKLRDELLPELGIRLEDYVQGKSVWKLEDPVKLKQELRIKKEEEEVEKRRRNKRRKKQKKRNSKQNNPRSLRKVCSRRMNTLHGMKRESQRIQKMAKRCQRVH